MRQRRAMSSTAITSAPTSRERCHWATKSTASSSAPRRRTTPIGGTARRPGQHDRLQRGGRASSSQSGTGDSILSNSIFSNGHLGIVLTGTANNAQTAPVLTGADRRWDRQQRPGVAHQRREHGFLIQFFSSLVPDPSGFGQGQTFLGSTTVTTDPTTGIATINFNLSSGLAVGTWVTATATNESTGDTSAFSNAVSAQPVSVAFSLGELYSRLDGRIRDDRRPAVRKPERGRLGELRHVERLGRRRPGLHGDLGHARVSARCNDRELLGHDPCQPQSLYQSFRPST